VAACAQNDKLRSTSAAIRTQSRSGRRNLEPTAYPAGETGRPASRRLLRVERDPGERERQLSALPRRSIPSSRRSAIHPEPTPSVGTKRQILSTRAKQLLAEAGHEGLETTLPSTLVLPSPMSR